MAFNAMKFVRNGKLNIFGGFVYFFNKAERAGKIGGKFKYLLGDFQTLLDSEI